MLLLALVKIGEINLIKIGEKSFIPFVKFHSSINLTWGQIFSISLDFAIPHLKTAEVSEMES